MGECWSGIVVGTVRWGALPQIMMGFLLYYWLIGVFDAHGEHLVMLFSLTIHCYIYHVLVPSCDGSILEPYSPVMTLSHLASIEFWIARICHSGVSLIVALSHPLDLCFVHGNEKCCFDSPALTLIFASLV
jgi:hypothetical protein